MKKTLTIALVGGLLLTLVGVVRSGWGPRSASAITKATTDSDRIAVLLNEMKTVDVANMSTLSTEPFQLPPAGVDVMRVRLEETYDVKGIGKDTVELTGWIAAKHDNARPAKGETEVKWDTAVVDTEFVGLELSGYSKVFGRVLVSLDPEHRSLGQVGKLDLPFVEQIALDVAYREFRPARTLNDFKVVSMPEPPGQRGTTEDRDAVNKMLQGVFNAIRNRSAAELLKFYAPGVLTFKGSQDEVAKQFADIKSIRVTPNTDVKIAFDRGIANVTATGKNEVIDLRGRKGTSLWALSLKFEKKDTAWLIIEDKTVLRPDRAAVEIGGHCLARISVDVKMPDLHITMKTKDPVKWYSEVETIPPVGYTASVSASSTPMIANDRAVATLEHGAVKFREIVRRIPLEGTNWSLVAAR